MWLVAIVAQAIITTAAAHATATATFGSKHDPE
jgi:hypothetical protein